MEHQVNIEYLHLTLVGKVIQLPPLESLQRDPSCIRDWIQYSVFDAETTWHLRNKLEEELRKMEWRNGKTLWDFYLQVK